MGRVDGEGGSAVEHPNVEEERSDSVFPASTAWS